jgi:type II secretory pathway pseudopilin PulG
MTAWTRSAIRRVRRGKSLVELLVVIGLTGVVMAMTSTTLVATFRAERQIRRDLAQQQTLARLATRFRADCHASRAASVDRLCELALPDERSIRYSAASSGIERVVLRGGNVEHRDTFALANGARVKIDAPAPFFGRLVRLTIQPDPEAYRPYATAIRPVTLEAAVGIGFMEGVP